MLRRGTLFAISLVIGVAACEAAMAQTVGRTISVKPGVFRNTAGTALSLGVGAPVVADDLLNTDVQGRTNLRFLDQSTLDIGPGSDVKIDRFVYNPNRTTAGASISLAKGVLRYSSRGAPDGAVSFEPPRARSAFAVLQQLSLITQIPERRGTRSVRASPKSARPMCRGGQHLRRRRSSARMDRHESGAPRVCDHHAARQ